MRRREPCGRKWNHGVWTVQQGPGTAPLPSRGGGVHSRGPSHPFRARQSPSAPPGTSYLSAMVSETLTKWDPPETVPPREMRVPGIEKDASPHETPRLERRGVRRGSIPGALRPPQSWRNWRFAGRTNDAPAAAPRYPYATRRALAMPFPALAPSRTCLETRRSPHPRFPDLRPHPPPSRRWLPRSPPRRWGCAP